MGKVSQMLNDMTFQELKELEQELARTNMRTEVLERIKHLEQQGMKTCPVCGGVVDISLRKHFALDFGPEDLRKRAHFDALDCLEYFIARLKDMQRRRVL